MKKKVQLSTSQVPPNERTEFWRAVVGPVYKVSPDEKYPEGEITTFSLANLAIGEIRSNGLVYQRDRLLINAGGLDSYLIHIISSGEISGDFDGTISKASVGDILVIDLARVVHSKVDPGQRITMVIPRDEMDKAVNWKNIHGLVLPGQAVSTRLIKKFMLGILEIGPELTSDEMDYTQKALIYLISSAISDRIDCAMFHEELHLKQSIVKYIHMNINDRGLDVSRITSEFKLSRAQLYRLFEAENGVAGYIKSKRLDYIFRLLAENRYKRVTAKQLAYEGGFDSPIALNKLFRERFGLTPKEMVNSPDRVRISQLKMEGRPGVREQVLDAAKLFLNQKN